MRFPAPAKHARIAEFCRDHLGDQYGIEFRAVDLTDMLPPDELADALNAVMRARNEAQANYARAEAKAASSCYRPVAASRSPAPAPAPWRRRSASLPGTSPRCTRTTPLDLYVKRRRAEVYSESRTVFVRRTP